MQKQKDKKQLHQQLLPLRQELEAQRITWLKKVRASQALLVVPILIFLGSTFGLIVLPAYFLLFIGLMVLACVLTATIYTQLVGKPIQKFRSAFKSKILEKVVHELYPEMHYDAKKHIPKEDFYASHIFHGKADQGYAGEDYFEGVVDGVPIRFSEVTAHKLSGKNTTVLFSGIFMILDVKKQFKGNTFVLPDNYEKILGQIALTVQEMLYRLTHGELVYLKEKPAFEQQFAIFSTHKEEAVEILCDEMLDSISWIREQYDSEIAISFQDGLVYVAIPLHHRHLFEADIYKSLTHDNSLLERIYAELATCFGLIDQLPLERLDD